MDKARNETARRKFWGWGLEDEGPDPRDLETAEAGLSALLGLRLQPPAEPPPPSQLGLPPPRPQVPAALAHLCTADPYERAAHTYGKSYRDLVRALSGDFGHAPDLVAFPRTAEDIVRLLDFCQARRVAVIPYGGGTSVCGGVEPDVGAGYAGTLSLDLGRMDRVLEVDPHSRAACIQAGALGPAIEDQLRPHGLTLRHFPQSFAFSSLGGWIATRSGGHFATLYTHIDELVESLHVITPTGAIATRRLPASGAGPAPERWFIGSEGALGIITSAWMRLFSRPRRRASATVAFADFLAGARFVRQVAQSGLHPANLRLLDPTEALMNRVGAGEAVVLLAFESADHDVAPDLQRALAGAGDHGGTVRPGRERPDGAAERWRQAFLRAPYLRDALVQRGLLVETFETAITWERFASFHEDVMRRTRAAITAACGTGLLSCRLTHAYPDGAAPYYTVIAPARRGSELAQWAAIKQAATEAILQGGGTTTHHHAVGRDFRPFYEHERPAGFARALAAVKRELDPGWVLNPGVLLPAS